MIYSDAKERGSMKERVRERNLQIREKKKTVSYTSGSHQGSEVESGETVVYKCIRLFALHHGWELKGKLGPMWWQ